MQLKNRLFLLGATGVILGGLAQACATEADSGDDIAEDAGAEDSGPAKDATADTGPKDAGRDAITDSTVPDVIDSGPADSGVRDAAPDAADAGGDKPGELFDPTALKEGDPCPAGTPNFAALDPRRCGYCGTQVAFCENGKVGAYGPCNREFTGTADGGQPYCLPNATRSGASCGLCGTQVQTCDDTTCQFADGVCENEVANGCPAGEVNFISGACANPDAVRKQTCSASCQLTAPEACAVQPIDTLIVPVDGSTTSATFNFSTTKVGYPDKIVCPATALHAPTPFHFVLLKNTSAVPVVVTSWVSTAPGGAAYDTYSAAYVGRGSRPYSDADLKACTGRTNDTCTTSPCVGTTTTWSGLTGADAVTIPANGSAVVMTSQYNGETAAGKPFQFNIKAPVPGPAAIDAPAQGTTVSYLYALNTVAPRVSGTCPSGSTSNASTPGTYITINNPTNTAKTVSVWEGATYGTNASIDTVMASYTTLPGDDAARKACLKGVNDTCSTAPCESDSGLIGTSAPVVPANGSLVIYVAAYYSTDPVGSKVLINVRTE